MFCKIIKQSKEETIQMYMTLDKKELAEMLYECNRILKIKMSSESKYSFEKPAQPDQNSNAINPLNHEQTK